MRLNLVGEIIDSDVNVGYSHADESVDVVFDDGFVADFQERLRSSQSQRAQSFASASGHKNRFQGQHGAADSQVVKAHDTAVVVKVGKEGDSFASGLFHEKKVGLLAAQTAEITVHHFGDRLFETHTAQKSAADVAVGKRAHHAPLGVDHQKRALRARKLVHPFERVVDCRCVADKMSFHIFSAVNKSFCRCEITKNLRLFQIITKECVPLMKCLRRGRNL